MRRRNGLTYLDLTVLSEASTSSIGRRLDVE